jgi:hypothetical protein
MQTSAAARWVTGANVSASTSATHVKASCPGQGDSEMEVVRSRLATRNEVLLVVGSALLWSEIAHRATGRVYDATPPSVMAAGIESVA